MLVIILFLASAVLPQESVDYLPADTLASIDLDLAEWDARRADTQAGQALASVNFLRGPLDILDRNWKGGPAMGSQGMGLRQMLGSNHVTVAATSSSLKRGTLLLVARPVALDLATATAGAYFMTQDTLAWVVDGPMVLALLRIPGSDPVATLESDRAWLEQWVAMTKIDGFRSLAKNKDWQHLRRTTTLPRAFASVWLMPQAWNHGMDLLGDRIQREYLGLDESLIKVGRQLVVEAYGLDRLRGIGFSTAIEGDRIHERLFLHGSGPTKGSGFGSSLLKPDPELDYFSEAGRCPANAGVAFGSINPASLIEWMDGIAETASEGFAIPLANAPEYQEMRSTLEVLTRSLGGYVLAVQKKAKNEGMVDVHVEIPLKDEKAWKEGVAALPLQLRTGFPMDLAQSGAGFPTRIEDGKLIIGTEMELESPRWSEADEFAAAKNWIQSNQGGADLNGVFLVDRVSNRLPLSTLRDNGAEIMQQLGLDLNFDLLQLQDDDYLDQVIGTTWGGAYSRPDGLQMDTLSPLGTLPGMVVGIANMASIPPFQGEQGFEDDEL